MLSKFCQYGVYIVESVVEVLANLGTGQDDLARDEYEQNDFGLDHAVDETGEELQSEGFDKEIISTGANSSDAAIMKERQDAPQVHNC